MAEPKNFFGRDGRAAHSNGTYDVAKYLVLLFAALSAVIGMLALNGLPMPYHPVFNVAEFARASDDKFFLVVFSSDPNYDAARTRSFLAALSPRMIAEVPS